MKRPALRVLFLFGAALMPKVVQPKEAPHALPAAVANDNTRPAGALKNGVLTLNLVASLANWYPGPYEAPPVEVLLFGEEGHAPSAPGPLIRIPLGTRVELTLRNTFRDTIRVAAMCTFPCKRADTLRVAPGRTGRLTFRPRAAGTFAYWAGTIKRGRLEVNDVTSQFAGVIVVDSGPARPDRIVTVSTYDHPRDTADAKKGNRLIFTFNGKAWPYTERFTYTVGDSVRWRVVHLGGGEHPLHLHGFYFRVERRGDGATDRALPRAEQPLVVTEEINTLGTFQMVWSPDRPGNWLFHCHKPVHISSDQLDALFDRQPDTTRHAMPMSDHHAMTGMSGLVLGITVRPASGVLAAGAPTDNAANPLRLVAQKVGQAYDSFEMLGYSLQRGDSAARVPKRSEANPIIFAMRGERTQITVVNQLSEPTAVHWHGIELESYYDGVAGWSGEGSAVAPLIAPRDSFVARFTAPRSGTFIYHTHANDDKQLMAGLYGALIVLEPGQKWNDTTDHVFALGDAYDWTVVNGSPSPTPMTLKAGVPHRLRFLSMMIDNETDVTISRDDRVVRWKPLAKDAIPVPASQRTLRPARLHFGPGETYDFEFTPSPGQYEMKVSAYTKVLLTIVAR